MSRLEAPYVITSSNVGYQPQAHDDIPGSNVDLKDFWLEDDCACAISPTHTLTSTVPHAALWQVHPQLYRASLPAAHEMAFNPMGSTGVAVLNQSASRLLDSFSVPMPLSAVRSKFPAIAPSDTLRIAHQFATLGLLVPSPENTAHHLSLDAPQSPPTTLTVWLHITNACNLRCDYCYVNKTPDEMEIERGKHAVDAVFRSAIANSFKRVKLKYAGGEASLNFSLVLVLHDYAKMLGEQYGIGVDGVMLSNGVALSVRMIQELRSRNLRLSISLDGIGEYHDNQRQFVNGRGSFAYVERTLDRLETHDFRPSITITVSNRNLEGLADVVDYVLSRGLPFTINFYRENECSASSGDLVYQDEKIIAAMRAAFAVIESELPPSSLLGALVDRARLDAPHDRPCGVGHSYLVIDQNGGVAKCHMEIEKTITDVSVADPLRVIREDHIGVQNLPVMEKEGCRECTWRYWCAGGCPALTHRVTGRWDVKSPNCRIYKALFPEVLRLEGLRLLKWSRLTA